MPVGVSAAVALALGLASGVAQPQDMPAVGLSLPQEGVQANDKFDVEVTVESVQGLGAFEFTLAYNPEIVEFVGVREGEFLGSSGRDINCLPPRPRVDAVRFACVSLGSEPPGPDGSGVLAVVTLKALREGFTPLELQDVILATIDAQPITRFVEGAELTVLPAAARGGGNTNWALWGSVIAGVAVVVLAGGLVGWRRLRP